MRWRRRARSGNLIDRRGARMGAIGLGALGIPGLVILLVVTLLGGGDLPDVGGALDGLGQAEEPGGPGEEGTPDPDAELVDFMSFVLDDAQRMWSRIFQASGRTYRDAELVLFTGATSSACGGATSDIGPHYCPADRRVYLDLEFFQELRARFGAPGDFAQAYVLAHEIGHHVQNLLGISDQVQRAQREDSDQANELSIRLELQADCFAGVWAHTTYERRLLESGDLQEGLDAAAAVGDDRLQRQSTGRIDRESWTHGSSAQRMRWLRQGFESGDPETCDTFAVDI